MWAGKVSVRHVLVLAGQLQLNPNSRCRMIRLGGDLRWIGWDTNSELAATQYDLIANFAAGKSFTDSDRFPRPGHQAQKDQGGALFAPSIAEFSVGAWMQMLNT